MERYNYLKAVKADVKDYIDENINFTNFYSLEELEEHLNNVLWIADEVTGNGSGSYTFNSWQAEEYLCHNWDLLEEAVSEWELNAKAILNGGAESADVTIRCYLLPQAISEVLGEIADDFEKAQEEKKEEVEE